MVLFSSGGEGINGHISSDPGVFIDNSAFNFTVGANPYLIKEQTYNAERRAI